MDVYQTYERLKELLKKDNLTEEQYENALKKIAEALGI